ncbi:hypothetical protein [Nitrospirillum viridazoti]|uniref:hypothetical protein n=1 Tax=Nitrospirillum viridazoti TaxID=3144925 RepID=UPI000593E033|nr:hypothetical protein [Nitrospirillum amazonense]
MATLEQIAARGDISNYEIDLEADEHAEALFYYAPVFATNHDEKLSHLGRKAGRKESPSEQVYSIIREFIIGRRLVYDVQRKRLVPDSNYVWEMKTQDVRIFGWFPRKSVFVAVDVELKDNLLEHDKYDPFINAVVSFRDALDLDPPKFLTGISANDLFC